MAPSVRGRLHRLVDQLTPASVAGNAANNDAPLGAELSRMGPNMKPDNETGPDPKPLVKQRPVRDMAEVPGKDSGKDWSFEFNAGQLEVQRRAGSRKDAEGVKQNLDPEFKYRFAPIMNRQRLAFVGSMSKDGFPWPSALIAPGDEEFIFEIQPDTNKLSVRQPGEQGGFTCPIYAENTKEPGDPMVILAVDFEKRSRFRANGHISAPAKVGEVVQVATQNNWINCAAFIPKVSMAAGAAQAVKRQPHVETMRGTSLSPDQQQIVSSAFSIYVCTAEGAKGPRVDLNMRGGSPGFVRVLGPNKIAFPDYPGNGSFFTVGNMTQYPKCGILFPFGEGGRMLQVVGDVEVKWDPGNCYEGMDREIIITVDQVQETRGVEDILEWKLKEMSAYSPPIGADVSWWHKFGTVSVFKLGEAAPGIMRLNFNSMGKTNWHWKPGQYATMLLPNQEGGEPLARSFTISQVQPAVGKEDGKMSLGFFGCHIKVFGRATEWLYNLPVDPGDQVMGGDNGTEVRILGIEGDFCLDVLERDEKVPPKLLFLSAGIGITPMLAMLNGLKYARSPRPSCRKTYPVDAVLLHTSRTVAEIVERQNLEKLAAESQTNPEWANGSIRVEWGLTGPEALPPGPHWHTGRMNEAILQTKVPDLAEREAFVCGPPDYMDFVVEMLHKKGLPLSKIHTEAFDTHA